MPKTLLVLLMMIALLTVPPVAAARPGTEAANEKTPLTEEDIFSGTFHTLEQVTGWVSWGFVFSMKLPVPRTSRNLLKLC